MHLIERKIIIEYNYYISKWGEKMFDKQKVGLLIGTGWLPEDYLIDEAKNFSAFKNCNNVLCLEGPLEMNRQVVMSMYLIIEKKEHWERSKGGLVNNDFNMGSSRKLWAVYPK